MFICIEPAVLLPPRSAPLSWRFIAVLSQSIGLAAAACGADAAWPCAMTGATVKATTVANDRKWKCFMESLRKELDGRDCRVHRAGGDDHDGSLRWTGGRNANQRPIQYVMKVLLRLGPVIEKSNSIGGFARTDAMKAARWMC